MCLLLSFCNQAASPHLCLLLLDPKNPESTQWIKLPDRAYRHFGGATGLAADERFIYAVGQIPSGSTELLIFDKNLTLKAIHPLGHVRDGHSICIKDSKLYIASTGSDQVFEISISDDFKNIREEVFWTSPDRNPEKQDNIHINSMAIINGALHISAFGKKEDDNWKATKNGYCLNIENDEYLAEGIFHPHTLLELNGRPIVCESQTGSLWIKEEGSNSIKKQIMLGGYIRGLAFDGEFYYAGRSADRKISRSTGKANTDVNKSKTSALLKLDKDFNLVEEFSLDGLCSEVYDILYLPNIKVKPEDTLKIRVSQLERRVKDVTAMYTELLLKKS